jgi:RNA ligase (TIGR02306 family)
MASGLAYIGQITEISDIENADYIQSATASCGPGGIWSVVIRKGDFDVGDLCEVYLQDALLPENDDRFSFMAKNNYRVRMMRLRGVPSEALVMPVSTHHDAEMFVGSDITHLIGVEKYEKQLRVSTSGDILGHFPAYIPKTDEPNFQKVPHLVDELRYDAFVGTIKEDGTSCTAYKDGDHIGVCSRNYELKETENSVLWNVTRASGIYDVLEELPRGTNIAFQFEVVGPGIQKNRGGYDALQVRVFDIFDIDVGEYMSHYRYRAICAHNYIPTVRLSIVGDSFNFTGDQLRELAEVKYENGRAGEGIVIRPKGTKRVLGERLSFKVINLNYRD